MALAVECTNCKKRYAVDESSAGKRVKCRNCGNVFTAEPLAKAASPGVWPSPAAAGAAGAAAAPPRRAVARPQAPGHGGGAAAVAAPPPPPPPLAPADEPPDFDALLALSAAEQSAPASDFPPPLPAPLPPPPPMPRTSAYAPSAYAAPAAPMMPIGYMPRPRRERRNMGVGLDNVTPWFIVLFVVAQVINVVRYLMKLSDLPAEVRRHVTVGAGAFITGEIVDVIMFFAVAATLIWLATYIASKIMKFALPDSAYMKAAGVAAIPGVIVTLMLLIPTNFVLYAALILAILPVMLWVVKFAFDMTWPEGLVAFAFVVPFYVVGFFIRVAILAAVFAGFGASDASFFGARNQGAFDPASSHGPSGLSFNPQGRQGDPAPDPEQSFEAERVRWFKGTVEAFANQNTEGTSREQMFARAKQLRSEIESQRSALGLIPGYDDLFKQLDEAKEKFAALPSEQPDDTIFRDAHPTARLDDAAKPPPGVLGPEISVKEFKLRPPTDAKLDLKGSENDVAGLTWHYGQAWGNATMSVALVPRRNPSQKQPWTLTQSFMQKARDQQRLFSIDVVGVTPEPVQVGAMNGLTFWRLELAPRSGGDRWVQYVTLDGDRWLLVVIRPGDNGRAKDEFELAAHTIRKAANEPHIDAFSPATLVDRLADDSQQATALLRRQGAAAEDALDAGLSNTDRGIRIQCAALLRTVATAKSLPALRQAVKSDDREVSDATRAIFRRVAPKEFDAVAEALLDLRSEGRDKQKALAALAAAKPDGRRAEVATLLEDMILNNKAGFIEKQVGGALGVWYGPKTVDRLLPLISDGTRPGLDSREWTALMALAGTKDKRVVMPIMVPWLLKDTEKAVPALIELGPLAEDAIVGNPVMTDPDPRVRTAAARVLERIGTVKCLEALARATHDRRGDRQGAATAATAAKRALDAVNARVAAAKATTRPRGGG